MERTEEVRIWIVNQYALTPSDGGGTRHYSLGKGLVRRGHEVYVVTSDVHYSTRSRLTNHSGLEKLDGVSFLWLRVPVPRHNSIDRLWNNLVFTYRCLLSASLGCLPRPDIVIGSSPHLFSAWAAHRLACRFGVPFILEVRDLWPESLIGLAGFSPYHPFVVALRAVELSLYRKAAVIAALMPRMPEYLSRLGIRNKAVLWLPNGVDLDMVPKPCPPRENPWFTVAYCGSHGPADGLQLLIEAARLIRDRGLGDRVRFVLMGDGIERPALEEAVSAMGLYNVVLTGLLPKSEVLSRLADADACFMFAMKSKVYDWGMSFNKVFDYLAVARPIILAGQLPDNPTETLGVGLTVPPDDAQQLAEAIIALSQTPVRDRYAMGLRGRRYVEEHHDFDVLSVQLETVLLSAIGIPASLAGNRSSRE